MKTLSLLIVILGTGAVVTGCDGKCSGTYNCPADSPSTSFSVMGLGSALVAVSAASPCSATLQGGDGGTTSVMVSSSVLSSSVTCALRGRLADGRAVAASVTFQQDTQSCCPIYVASGESFTVVDASTDGP